MSKAFSFTQTSSSLQDLSRRLESVSLKSAMADNVYARRIAFVMGCSENSRVASGCPPAMQKLPDELVRKILSHVTTPIDDLAALDKRMSEHLNKCSTCPRGVRVYDGRIQEVEMEQCNSPDYNPYGPCSVCRCGPSVVAAKEVSNCAVASELNRQRRELLEAAEAEEAEADRVARAAALQHAEAARHKTNRLESAEARRLEQFLERRMEAQRAKLARHAARIRERRRNILSDTLRQSPLTRCTSSTPMDSLDSFMRSAAPNPECWPCQELE